MDYKAKTGQVIWRVAMLLALSGAIMAAGSVWTVVTSPNAGTTNFLYSVAAISAFDVWAIGYDYDASNRQFTLVEHWDGSKWSRVPSPSPGTATNCGTGYSGNMLNGITAVSSIDVWAVGEICGYGNMKTLTEHWNGYKWQIIPSPRPGRNDSTLVAVAAASGNDVWAVGNSQVSGFYQWNTLIEHWDGAKWSIVKSPNVPGADKNFLNGVAMVSPTDVWAVGYSEEGVQGTIDAPLIEHYDGRSWSISASPFPKPSQFNALYGITALTANNVWAVGYANENSRGQNGQALIEHWDGAKWTLVASPIAGNATILLGIASLSAANLTAVGYIQTSNVQFLPVTEHWDGTRWNVVNPPNAGKVAQLFGAAAANGKTWAVGAYSPLPMSQGYMENPRTFALEK
jgi:hypothetical protein